MLAKPADRSMTLELDVQTNEWLVSLRFGEPWRVNHVYKIHLSQSTWCPQLTLSPTETPTSNSGVFIKILPHFGFAIWMVLAPFPLGSDWAIFSICWHTSFWSLLVQCTENGRDTQSLCTPTVSAQKWVHPSVFWRVRWMSKTGGKDFAEGGRQK